MGTVGMVGMVYMYVYGEQWAQLWNCHKNLSSAVGEAVLTACNSCQPIISAEKTEVLKKGKSSNENSCPPKISAEKTEVLKRESLQKSVPRDV